MHGLSTGFDANKKTNYNCVVLNWKEISLCIVIKMFMIQKILVGNRFVRFTAQSTNIYKGIFGIKRRQRMDHNSKILLIGSQIYSEILLCMSLF